LAFWWGLRSFKELTRIPVLRIFGVYTLARLDRAFWDSVSKQISKRGKTYKAKYFKPTTIQVFPGLNYKTRCKARKNCGKDLYSPVTFSETEEDSSDENMPYMSMREQDFEKVRFFNGSFYD
jgi:hypothetical protein